MNQKIPKRHSGGAVWFHNGNLAKHNYLMAKQRNPLLTIAKFQISPARRPPCSARGSAPTASGLHARRPARLAVAARSATRLSPLAGDRGVDRRVGSLEEGEAGGHRSSDPAVPRAPPHRSWHLARRGREPMSHRGRGRGDAQEMKMQGGRGVPRSVDVGGGEVRRRWWPAAATATAAVSSSWLLAGAGDLIRFYPHPAPTRGCSPPRPNLLASKPITTHTNGSPFENPGILYIFRKIRRPLNFQYLRSV